MNCCNTNIPEEAEAFFSAEKDPEIIRVDFRVDNDYYLVLDRNVPFTLTGFFDYNQNTDTYTLEPGGWSVVTLEFHDDLDVSNGPIATFNFQVIDEGVIDPDYVPGSGAMPSYDNSERWQGVFPDSELNKLAGKEWVFAKLIGDDGDLISLCVFNVVGG